MRQIVLFLYSVVSLGSIGQNEAAKWYIGYGVGLDFLSSPPGQLSGGAMNVASANGTISDPSGSLLFYTDGDKIWNAQHQVMANGTGINGKTSAEQSGLIVRQPSTSKYYVFTNADFTVGAVEYALVDMSLAAGLGSVVSKNNVLIPGYTVSPPPTYQMAVTQHANGTDFWVVFHGYLDNTFKTFSISSTGINPAAVVSVVGPTVTQQSNGYFRFSPNGQKLAMIAASAPSGIYFFDFDTQSGLLTGPTLTLSTDPFFCGDFSPDGTKFYASLFPPNVQEIRQWDLCAGSNAAIIASEYTISTVPRSVSLMQLAYNGNIYFNGGGGGNSLGIIHNPNQAGNTVSVSPAGQPLPGTSGAGLPAFVKKYFNHVPGIFSHSLATCGAVSFTAPCLGPMTYSSVKWDFGDLSNPTTNTSVAFYSSHQYNAPGTYTVKLSVISGTNTTVFYQVISVSTIPSLTVTGKTKICKGESVTLTVGGASTYSWNGTAGSNVMTFTPTSSGAFTVTGQDTVQCMATKVHSVEVQPCLGLSEPSYNEIIVYPNPGNGVFQIDGPALPHSVTVRDCLGRDLLRLNQSGKGLDLTGLQDGMYLVEMYFGAATRVVRLVKSQ
jgi:hypothetical protein